MNKSNRAIQPLALSILLTAILAGCGGGGTAAINNPAPTAPGAGSGAGAGGHGPLPVVLGGAGSFAILSKSGITNVPTSAITGNIGASPISATAMNNVTCSEMLGGSLIYGVDATYTGGAGGVACFKGTPSDKTTVDNAVLDMGTAYTDAASRPADFTEVGAGNISGMTLPAGTYKWGTGVLITSNVTLTGGANDVWIFEIAQDLTVANNATMTLAGAALPKNIFWQVGGGTGVAIGTSAHVEGVILATKGITLNTSASANSRLLAQTAVTLNKNTVTQPAP
jgi:hypothetical protein